MWSGGFDLWSKREVLCKVCLRTIATRFFVSKSYTGAFRTAQHVSSFNILQSTSLPVFTPKQKAPVTRYLLPENEKFFEENINLAAGIAIGYVLIIARRD